MAAASAARSILALALLAGAVAGCDEPFFLLPGGALDGAPAPVPDDWSATDDVKTVQLETRPADPYSVNKIGRAHV